MMYELLVLWGEVFLVVSVLMSILWVITYVNSPLWKTFSVPITIMFLNFLYSIGVEYFFGGA